MAIVDSNKKICTLINVFTVEPAKQQELFDTLVAASENAMSKMQGYISANFHLGDDGKTVTNYAQWASLADYQKVFGVPEVMEHLKKAGALALEIKPVTYSTIRTHANND